jgi:hypothetical protein
MITDTPTFTELLLQVVLRAFARGRYPLTLTWRTLSGVGQGQLVIDPEPAVLPIRLLDLLAEPVAPEFRTPLTTWTPDGRPAELTVGACLWRLPMQFGAPAWRHQVDPAAAAKVREGLADFSLPPAWLVDAQHEVWAAWPLAAPLTVDRDPEPAVGLLTALARHLGGDVAGVQDLTATLPVAGVVRNCGRQAPLPHEEILPGAPGARYAVQDLMAACGGGRE